MEVIPVKGAYLVLPDRVYVFKDKSCTCSKTSCNHVQAVVEYRRDGGKKAVEDDVYEIYDACPICGEKRSLDHNPRCWILFNGAKVAAWYMQDEGKIWSYYNLTREEWFDNASDSN